MPARRIIGVAALAEANSPLNRFAGISGVGVSRWKLRDLLTRARLTARSMTAAPHEWLTKVAPNESPSVPDATDILSRKKELEVIKEAL